MKRGHGREPVEFHDDVVNKTACGFTLIELLVVVLIIGILAAVAVPQYQKAVYKSRAVEAVNMLKALTQAQNVYYLANGQWTTDFKKLDIEIPNNQITDWTETDATHPETYMYSCTSWGAGPVLQMLPIKICRCFK